MTRFDVRLVASALLCLAGTHALAQGAPRHPWLADSPWPISHHDAHASAASESPGPRRAADLGAPQFVYTGPINITQAMSPAYPDGQRVWWGNDVFQVYKLGLVNGRLTKLATLRKSGNVLSALRTPTSGAYTLVTRDNHYISVQGRTLSVYADVNPRERRSTIRLLREFTLPDTVAATDDAIVGLNILWDGHLAFATRQGVVGVIDPGLQQVRHVRLGGAQEEVSNSIAADAQGGIYVVSDQAMYRVQWTGHTVSLDASTGAWRAPYNAGDGTSTGAGRLGKGSGTTPSLMEVDGQRFVAITDGATLNNVVLFWRDAIPADWAGLGGGRDRRLAAEVPVNFNDPQRTATLNEQSLVVSGGGIAAVSNDYQRVETLSQVGSAGGPVLTNLTNGLIQLFSAAPSVQPWGVQKFEWDPQQRVLRSVWARRDVSCPNAIPTMSVPSQRFYCVGAYQSQWTIESLDWRTGGQHFRKVLGIWPRYNSFYAATQLTGDGGLIYGSVNGVVYLPPAR
jgi:hypothetical protein